MTPLRETEENTVTSATRSTSTFVLVLSLTALTLGISPSSAWGKSGSITIKSTNHQDDKWPAGTQVRVTAKAADGTTYDETFAVAGLTTTEIRDLIRNDMQAEGWTVVDLGDKGLQITSHGSGVSKSKIIEIDVGDNRKHLDTTTDGNVKRGEVRLGQKKIRWLCSLPNADGTNPGTIFVNLDDGTNFFAAEADLNPNDTPEDAAAKLQAAVSGLGLVATLSGAEVTFDWEDATNDSALSGDELNIDFGVKASDTAGAITEPGGGPHVTIVLPDTIDIPTVSEWGMMAMVLLVLTAGTVVFTRLRRPATA